MMLSYWPCKSWDVCSPSFCSASALEPELASALFWDLLTTPLTKARLSPLDRPTMACITPPAQLPSLMLTITGDCEDHQSSELAPSHASHINGHFLLCNSVTSGCFYKRRTRTLPSGFYQQDLISPGRPVSKLCSLNLSVGNWFSETRTIVKWRSTEMIMIDLEHDFYFTAAAKIVNRRLLNIV